MNTANIIGPPTDPDGKLLPDHAVVAADLIALVAGVNLASVNKVIQAINLISVTLDQSFEDLLDIGSLPTERANPERLTFTDQAARRIVSQPEALALESQLHFVERMSRH